MGLWEGEGGQAGEGSSPGPATFAFPQQSEVQSNPLTPFSHSELLSADHHAPWGGSKLQAGAGSTMALNGLGVCPCVFKERWCPGHRGSQCGQTSGGQLVLSQFAGGKVVGRGSTQELPGGGVFQLPCTLLCLEGPPSTSTPLAACLPLPPLWKTFATLLLIPMGSGSELCSLPGSKTPQPVLPTSSHCSPHWSPTSAWLF